MKKEYTEELKNVIQSVYAMADNMDAKGIGANIPIVDKEDGMRGAIKTDILLFLLSLPDRDRRISPACLQFINECLGYDLSELRIETARKRIADSTSPQICALLPYFILIDKLIGNCKVSSVYVKTLCYMALGCIGSQEVTSLEELVRYNRYASACMQMIEEMLHEKMDFDPLCFADSKKKDLILSAIEVDKMLHKSEEDPVVRTLEEEVRRIAGGEETACETVDDEIMAIPKPDPVKEPGDGSDLPDETVAECNEAGETGFASALEEMDALIGLDDVKTQVKTLVNVFKIQQKCRELNIRRPAITMHMAFIGNPGTGKTAMARILGKVYKESGLLSKGHLVEAGRADLVGKYVGHTAVIVKEVFEKARGGVLFIDEAYSLLDGDSGGYGQEAIETLLKLMEDNRDDIAVIVAGYPALMQEFLDANPRVRSRFPLVIRFPDYSGLELAWIFRCFCRENDIVPSVEIMQAVRSHFTREVSRRIRNYGNARAVRNYFERMIMNQANRLVEAGCYDRKDLCRFTMEDLPSDNILTNPRV